MRKYDGMMLSAACFLLMSSCAYGQDDDTDTGLVVQALSCTSIEDNSCCKEGPNSCGISYGDRIQEYMGFESHSNGKCTESIFGAYQCAQFAKLFYASKEAFGSNNLKWTAPWGKAGNAVESVVYDTNAVNRTIFVIDPDGLDRRYPGLTKEEKLRLTRPRETDIITHESWSKTGIEGFGHAVVVRNGITEENGVMRIPVIEENYVDPDNCGNPRVLTAEANESGIYSVDSGFSNGYTYAGLIRHNLAGIYQDPIGWNANGTSRSFYDAWDRFKDGNGHRLGFAFDNGGGIFIHEVDGILFQDFWNPYRDNRYGNDGQTALAYNRTKKEAYLIREDFWGAYKCLPGRSGGWMGGTDYLGAPASDAYPAIVDGKCNETSDGIPVPYFQRFDHGCMWSFSLGGKVHIYQYSSGSIPDAKLDAAKARCYGLIIENNPPGPDDCSHECLPGDRRCDGTAGVQICGYPEDDGCYRWLGTMQCASGLSCVEGACVDEVPDGVDTDTGSDTDVDPAAYCGDGECLDGENCLNCGLDCGQCPDTSGDGNTDLGTDSYIDSDTDTDSDTGAQDIAPTAIRCTSCGDGICDPGETAWSCPSDCTFGSYCGDGKCLDGELPTDCPADCRVYDSCVPGGRRCDGMRHYASCLSGRQAGTAYWDIWPCPDDTSCRDDGQCLPTGGNSDTCTDTDIETDISTYPGVVYNDPTVECRLGDSGLEVTLRGLAPETLIEAPGTPSAIQYGSDSGGWEVPYTSDTIRETLAWNGWRETYVFLLPPDTTRFNLYVADSDDPARDSWLDLDPGWGPPGIPWSVTGDCELGDRIIVVK